MKFADLHLHSVFSDGIYTPEELISISKRKGLSCVSIADHDTVAGIEPSILAAEKEDIEVLPAIELSAEYKGVEIHILGYLIDYKDGRLIKRLNFLKEKRIERILKMIEKLKKLNINIESDEIDEFASKGTVTRLHLAQILLKKGYVSSISQAFKSYIGDRSPAYVCGFHFSPQEAISLIKEIEGIPVLAHPHSINHDDLIPVFVGYGLGGLEVYYPEYTSQQRIYYENLAKKYNLLITGGSDFHGNVRPKVEIGCIKIPYQLVERLKRLKYEN